MKQTKKCPYCGLEILAVAKKCKHCGKWLNEDATEAERNTVNDEPIDTEPEAEEADQTPLVSPMPQKKAVKEKSDNKIFWVAIIFFAILLTIYVFRTCSSKEENIVVNETEATSVPNDNSTYDTSSETDEIDAESSLDESLNDDDESTEEQVKMRIKLIYLDVFNSGGTNLEKKYFTWGLYNAYSKVKAKEADEGDILLDYNVWHQAQDWGDTSIEVNKVDVRDENKASAEINMIDKYSDGSKHNKIIRLSLLKEDGEWKISDMGSGVNGLRATLEYILNIENEVQNY